ncbi:MAG: hypothetical protein LBN11_03115, partial [Tannerella sp.]|nr:hypothetical protein [Tannerella sp.]
RENEEKAEKETGKWIKKQLELSEPNQYNISGYQFSDEVQNRDNLMCAKSGVLKFRLNLFHRNPY